MNKILMSLALAFAPNLPAQAEENILDAEAAIKNGAPRVAADGLGRVRHARRKRGD